MEKSKKIESDEKNAKLVKAYIYKKVSEENPQMTGMDKILLIKGMNNDELVKFISKMPELEKIEKDIQKHIEKKHKVKIYSLLVKRLNIDTLTHAKVTSR